MGYIRSKLKKLVPIFIGFYLVICAGSISYKAIVEKSTGDGGINAPFIVPTALLWAQAYDPQSIEGDANPTKPTGQGAEAIQIFKDWEGVDVEKILNLNDPEEYQHKLVPLR